MGTVGGGFMDTITGFFGMKKEDAAASMEAPVSALPTSTDLGMSAEPSGMSTSGGRRFSKMRKGKKTRKGGRRGRKTQRK